MLHFITNSAAVNFDEGWWANDRAQTLVRQIGTLALVLTLLFLLLAVVQGLFAGDVGGMLRATLLEVPVTIGATVALVAVTQLLLGLVDGASAMVLSGVPEALGHFFDGFGSTATIATNGFAGILMVAVFLLGAILVWIELVVRSSLIYLLMAAAPLTLAARVWPAARGAWRRLAELGLALIVSKFAIALALGLGAAALAGGGPKSGDLGTKVGMDLAAMLTGASLMLLAAFTPFIVLRLLPIVEGAVIAQGISRSPVRAAQGGMQAAYYAQGLARMAGGRGGRSGGTAAPGPGRPRSACRWRSRWRARQVPEPVEHPPVQAQVARSSGARCRWAPPGGGAGGGPRVAEPVARTQVPEPVEHPPEEARWRALGVRVARSAACWRAAVAGRQPFGWPRRWRRDGLGSGRRRRRRRCCGRVRRHSRRGHGGRRRGPLGQEGGDVDGERHAAEDRRRERGPHLPPLRPRPHRGHAGPQRCPGRGPGPGGRSWPCWPAPWAPAWWAWPSPWPWPASWPSCGSAASPWSRRRRRGSASG